jgi:sugar phosphate isomerase/epimerase
MKIGINIDAYNGLDLEKQVELMKENGFTSTFFMSDSPFANRICELSGKAGIVCESVHAPFDGINDIWADDNSGEIMLKRLFDSVDVCKRHCIPVSVVHISSGVPAPRINDVGFDRFKRLVDYADKNGVKIAFENQRVLSNIAYLFEQLENTGFCWDVGHEEAFAHGRRYMPLFGDRIAAVHIHDNMKIHNGDIHILPYDGKIDFEYVASEIAARGYDKAVMLEVMTANSNLYNNVSPEDYYKKAATVATMLGGRIEYYKTKKTVI